MVAEVRAASYETPGPTLGGTADADGVQGVIDWLAGAVDGLDDVGRVDLIGRLEAVKPRPRPRRHG